MKNLIFYLLLLFVISNNSMAQNTSVNEFYNFLNHFLENKNFKQISLDIANYGCLGSKIFSEIILSKNKDHIEIKYFNYRPENDLKPEALEKFLDTTFTVSKNNLISNFKNEIIAIQSRVVYLDAEYHIKVITGNFKKEFQIQRAEGLEYLLRYNRSYEMYFKIRNIGQKQ